ncbi:LysR family transcriptional regulator [Cytobacillus sp. Bac17]|uniref:LysR family transcriptional regulator n=1 Tax=Cytobacillus sp. Bac17 TaxID=2926008 RepID=UPI002118D1AA|nr:LysR family transcriptional regulator [Cytobacillus sp. Bac17]
MNIEQFEAFVYVSMTENFSKAGEILYISQPSVSARIKTLENEIGYTLFNRNGKNVKLTKEGEKLLPYAKNILQNIQEGILAIQKTNSKTEGEISIATVLTVGNYIFPSLVNEFFQLYPSIKLVVQTGHSPNVLDMVLNHEVPLGICRSVSHPQIETIHLFDDEMVLAIYPEHPFYSRKTVTIQEVAIQPLFLFNRGSLDWALINNAFKSMSEKPNVIMEIDNIEMVQQMVKKQMGIALLPRFSIEEDIKANRLGIVKIEELPLLSRPLQLIYLKDSKIDGVLRIFVDFLIRKFSNLHVVEHKIG